MYIVKDALHQHFPHMKNAMSVIWLAGPLTKHKTINYVSQNIRLVITIVWFSAIICIGNLLSTGVLSICRMKTRLTPAGKLWAVGDSTMLVQYTVSPEQNIPKWRCSANIRNLTYWKSDRLLYWDIFYIHLTYEHV